MAFMDAYFNITLLAVVAALMLSTGLLAEPKEVMSYFQGKRLILTSRVIAMNIIVIPVLTFIMLKTSFFDPSVALVIFLLAIAPAAPLIPPMVHVNKGDMNWSLVLIFLLTLISLVTIPLMVFLGNGLLAEQIALNQVSSSSFFANYVIPVFAPLAIGVSIKQFSRNLAVKLMPITDKIVKVSNACLMILVVLINYDELANMELFPTLLMIAFIAICTLLGALSIYPVAKKEQYITATITSGLRNFAIVLLLLDVLTDDRSILLLIIPVSLVPIIVCGLTGWYVSRKTAAMT